MRAPRHYSHEDPRIDEFIRDTRTLFEEIMAVELLSFETKGSSNGKQFLLRTVKRPKSVTIASIKIKGAPATVVDAGAVRWEYDGKLIVYGIGGLIAATTYEVVLRVEGE
jgi:hypothetical protein